MSTTTAPRPVASSSARRPHTLAGTGKLLRFNLRRDRIRIPAWVLAIGFVMVSAPGTYEGLYPTAEDRLSQAEIVGDNPAMKAMSGPGYGIDAGYPYGAMLANEYLGFIVVFVALMSVFIVIRHTRAEEETGRAELVRSNVIGRHAQLMAALLTAVVANAALGLLVGLGMGSSGIDSVDMAGSMLFGTAMAAVGLVFAGIAAVTAQVTEHSRAASGIAGALIGVAYMLRAIGDTGGSALSWLSPIGWAQQTKVFVDDRWWPLGISVVLTVALIVTAFAIESRRDVGAGLMAQRPGNEHAAPWLGSPMGLAWRLQRSSTVWWAIALFIFGASYGSAADVIEDYENNEFIQDMMASVGGASLTESWLSVIVSVLAIVCSIYAIITVSRPKREEASGRAEPVLATAMSRTRYLGSHVAIALAGGTALLAITSAGLGATSAALLEDSGFFWEVLGAGMAYAPALWVSVGFAVALYGLVPQWAALAWAVPVYSIFMAYMGDFLQLPDWMVNVSPFMTISQLPAETMAWTSPVIQTALAMAMLIVGFTAFNQRDLTTK